MTDLGALTRELRALADSGRPDEARERLDAAETRGVADAAGHLALGLLAEQMGALERAILEYNLSLRDEGAQAPVLLRLARLRADRGEAERAVRAYRRLLELTPTDADALLEMGAVLEETGRSDEAAAAYESFLERADHAGVRAEAKRLGRAGSGKEAGGTGPAEPRAITPDDADLVTFSSVFSGREGVHARQWASPTGKHGYTPVEEPFTPAVAKGHLLGAYTVGIYPVRSDNTVGFLAFDLDVARFALARDSRNPNGAAALLRQAHSVACRLVDAAAMHDMSAVIEESGWKGRHVWVFFEVPVPAAAARRLADVFLAAAGEPPPEVTVEVFPKQGRVAEGGLGNLIKLPLGVHRVTGRRSLFVEPAGRPVEGQLELLRQVARVPREVVRRVVERSSSVAVRSPAEPPRTEAFEPEETSTRELVSRVAPAEAPYDPDQDLEYQWLLDRCAVLAEVARRARASGVLSNDERNVLTYTVGHLTSGPQAVNAVLSGLLSVDATAFLKSRLKGNPMSCPKVRSRLPEIASGVGCACRFEADAGLYPTPLLHLQALRARGVLEKSISRLSALQVERLVQDLVRVRGEIERMTRLARELETRLREFMAEQGVVELNTAAGTLRDDAGRLSLGLGPSLPALPAPRSDDDGAIRHGAGSGGRAEEGSHRGEEGGPDAPGLPH